jgi:hypothetical protein
MRLLLNCYSAHKPYVLIAITPAEWEEILAIHQCFQRVHQQVTPYCIGTRPVGCLSYNWAIVNETSNPLDIPQEWGRLYNNSYLVVPDSCNLLTTYIPDTSLKYILLHHGHSLQFAVAGCCTLLIPTTLLIPINALDKIFREQHEVCHESTPSHE